LASACFFAIARAWPASFERIDAQVGVTAALALRPVRLAPAMASAPLSAPAAKAWACA
jgi:hypothetical protein